MNNYYESLCGIRVLNTRPLGVNKVLSQEIQNAGGSVIELPALGIEPLTAWLDNIDEMLDASYAIFISTNAVHNFFQGLAQHKIMWPPHIHIIAIGAATAKAVKQYNKSADDTPIVADSEHLLALDVLQNIAMRNVLIIKGVGGRTTIADTLAARGAIIKNLLVYQRTMPVVDAKFVHFIWHENAVDIILLTSVQAIQHLVTLFHEPEALAWLYSKPCIVISERLAKVALARGFQNCIIGRHDTILATLCKRIGKMSEANDTELKQPIDTPEHIISTRAYKRHYLHTILLLVALVVSGVALYTAKQLKSSIMTLQTHQEQAQILAAKHLAAALAQNNTLSAQVQQLTAQVHEAIHVSPDNQNIWLLLKARYYLELAQINTHWHNDNATTLALLETANQVVANINSTDVSAVKQAINAAQADLQAAQSQDIGAILKQLNGVQQTISNLPTVPVLAVDNKIGHNQQESPVTGWHAQLNKAILLMQPFIVVRHHETNDILLRTPTDLRMLHERINLTLQEAQWSVLQGDNAIYQLSLTQALAQIKTLLTASNDDLQQLIQQLKELKKIKFLKSNISLDKAISLLNQLIAAIHTPVPVSADESAS